VLGKLICFLLGHEWKYDATKTWRYCIRCGILQHNQYDEYGKAAWVSREVVKCTQDAS
jgi:hypothetical protein